jgi:Fe-S-cluster containining protein
VTRLDARRLRIGLEQLRVTNPGQANAIEARAGHAARKLTAGYPGDRKSGRLVADAGRLDRYFAGHATMACPVLDPASGRCGLYAARPMACRIYGPPSRFGSECAEACPLCFTDAGRELIESCRLEADRDDLEAELLRAMGVSETEPWETLIAFVLARPLPQA